MNELLLYKDLSCYSKIFQKKNLVLVNNMKMVNII